VLRARLLADAPAHFANPKIIQLCGLASGAVDAVRLLK
jgi:hypothetical protein